ncbi:hypothetical protein GCM10027217_30830 [Pseudomaricurvus hydrocarbonicus]
MKRQAEFVRVLRGTDEALWRQGIKPDLQEYSDSGIGRAGTVNVRQPHSKCSVGAVFRWIGG